MVSFIDNKINKKRGGIYASAVAGRGLEFAGFITRSIQAGTAAAPFAAKSTHAPTSAERHSAL